MSKWAIVKCVALTILAVGLIQGALMWGLMRSGGWYDLILEHNFRNGDYEAGYKLIHDEGRLDVLRRMALSSDPLDAGRAAMLMGWPKSEDGLSIFLGLAASDEGPRFGEGVMALGFARPWSQMTRERIVRIIQDTKSAEKIRQMLSSFSSLDSNGDPTPETVWIALVAKCEDFPDDASLKKMLDHAKQRRAGVRRADSAADGSGGGGGGLPEASRG